MLLSEKSNAEKVIPRSSGYEGSSSDTGGTIRRVVGIGATNDPLDRGWGALWLVPFRPSLTNLV